MITFNVVDVPKFLQLINLFKGDDEFLLHFLPGSMMHLNSLMMAGVVCLTAIVDVHTSTMLQAMKYTDDTRQDIKHTMRFNSKAFVQVLQVLCRLKIHHIQAEVTPEQMTMNVFDGHGTLLSNCSVHALTIDDEDVDPLDIPDDIDTQYLVTVLAKAVVFRDYFNDDKCDTIITCRQGTLTWCYQHTLTTTSLFWSQPYSVHGTPTDFRLVLLASTLSPMKQYLQFVGNDTVSLHLSNEMPIFFEASTSGIFIRLLAGLKDE